MLKESNRVILIVHCAPLNNNAWQALRVCRSLCEQQYWVMCFFDQAGVAHANLPAAVEPGMTCLYSAYTELAKQQADQLQLQVCRAAWARRYSGALEQPWLASGLVELADTISNSARVLSFG